MKAEEKRNYKSLCTAFKNAETDRQERESVWEKSEELYSGRFDVAATDPTDQIYPNVCQPTINVVVAETLSRPPEVAVTARKADDAPRARLLRGLNRYWWDVDDIQTQAQESLRDAGIFGVGVLKTLWKYDEIRYVPPDPKDVSAMADYRDMVLAAGAVRDLPTDEEIVKFLQKETVQIIDNRPEARRVSIKEIFLDSQARSLREVNWIGHRYHRPLEDVVKDEWLSRSVRDDMKKVSADDEYSPKTGQAPSSMDNGRRTMENDTAGTELVEMVEIWDIRRRQLYIFRYEDISNVDKLLYAGGWPFAIGHPFVFLTLGPSFTLPDQVYPLSLCEMIGPEQYELTMIARELMRQRMYTRQKFGMDADAWTEDAEKALKSSINGDVAKLENLNGRPIRDVLAELPGLHVDPQLYTQRGEVEAWITKKVGITEQQRGGAAGGRTSATEVSTIEEYAQGRVNLLVHAVQQAMVEVARKMCGLASQYMVTKQVARIVGMGIADLPPNPDAYVVDGQLIYPFDRKDIAGEYDFSISIVNAQSDTPAARAEKILRFRQAFGGSPYLNEQALISEYAKEIGLPDPERFIMDPTQQMPQQGPGQPSIAGVPGMAAGGGQPPGVRPQLAVAGRQGGMANAQRPQLPAVGAGR